MCKQTRASSSCSGSLPPVYVMGLGLPAPCGRAADSPWAGVAARLRGHPLLREADILIGGKAQLAAFAEHPAERIVVDADIPGLYARMERARAKGKRLVVLCSGDPLFFGLGARLIELFGPESLRFIPAVSSLQASAAFLGLAWEDLLPVSLHGRRDMARLAHALAAGRPLFLLCDKKNTPRTIAAWMLERGCDAFRMHVLDNLCCGADGQVRAERHAVFRLDQAMVWDDPVTTDQNGAFASGAVQRVILLVPEDPADGPDAGRELPPGNTERACKGSLRPDSARSASGARRPFGVRDAAFAVENNLVTKAPIRAAGLAALAIAPHHIVWDLGAGSGAVSVEAARLAYLGQVFAVEQSPARLRLIRENRQRFGVANLEIVPGNMPGILPALPALENEDAFCASFPLPRPHRIFLGGGLGGDFRTAREIVRTAWAALLPGGRLLAHCILLSSLERARALLRELDASSISVSCLQASHSAPLARDMRLEAQNPVFLVLAEKSLAPGGSPDLAPESERIL